MEYFEGLSPILRAFWFIAIPSSLIFLIQTILTFIGLDSSDGLDADFDGDFSYDGEPFQLFSFRNLINFLLGFSWTGLSFYNTIDNKNILILISLLVGASFVYLFFIIIRQVQKLSENNSFKINDTIGLIGEVYLPVPANNSGTGKILVSVKGSLRELDALSEKEEIASQTKVKIISVVSNSLVKVETI